MTLRILRRAALILDANATPTLRTTPRKRETEAIQTSGTPSKVMAELVYPRVLMNRLQKRMVMKMQE